MLFRNIFTLALVGILGLWSNMSLAQSLTLDAAIRRTLDSHPLLKAEGSATQAVERQASLDGLAPAPFISTELEKLCRHRNTEWRQQCGSECSIGPRL